jgi:hypothetical protein
MEAATRVVVVDLRRLRHDEDKNVSKKRSYDARRKGGVELLVRVNPNTTDFYTGETSSFPHGLIMGSCSRVGAGIGHNGFWALHGLDRSNGPAQMGHE